MTLVIVISSLAVVTKKFEMVLFGVSDFVSVCDVTIVVNVGRAVCPCSSGPHAIHSMCFAICNPRKKYKWITCSYYLFSNTNIVPTYQRLDVFFGAQIQKKPSATHPKQIFF